MIKMIGLTLEACPRLENRCQQKQELRLKLKQLIRLKQELKLEEPPNPIRGLAGMQKAHNILQKKKARGVLIGGLSESVWSLRRKEHHLEEHKDVDVLVLDDVSIEWFEGGIDWWLPRRKRLTIKSEFIGEIEGVEKQFYTNGHGAILHFGVQLKRSLPPGLYIPDSEWVVAMRLAEVTAMIDYGRVAVEFDEDVSEKFREHIRKRVKTRLPRFIREAFKGYILSPHYEPEMDMVYAIEIELFDLRTLRAILSST